MTNETREDFVLYDTKMKQYVCPGRSRSVSAMYAQGYTFEHAQLVVKANEGHFTMHARVTVTCVEG